MTTHWTDLPLSTPYLDDTSMILNVRWTQEQALGRARGFYLDGRLSLAEYERWVETILRTCRP